MLFSRLSSPQHIWQGIADRIRVSRIVQPLGDTGSRSHAKTPCARSMRSDDPRFSDPGFGNGSGPRRHTTIVLYGTALPNTPGTFRSNPSVVNLVAGVVCTAFPEQCQSAPQAEFESVARHRGRLGVGHRRRVTAVELGRWGCIGIVESDEPQPGPTT